MKKYEECKDMRIDLECIGGNRYFTIENLVNEIVRNRRKRLWRVILAIGEGEISKNFIFDAISFKAITDHYFEVFDYISKNYEGTIEYEVIAGSDWKWHCKTTITWKPNLLLAYGMCEYHTEIVANENVEENRIHLMTGTLMEIRVIRNDVSLITCDEAFKRFKCK